ncbi:MAG: argininosuccinate synthase [Acidobacteriota bacterium]|nr:argininosuccinate synthase [Acidobacteriota bacterium]MDE3092347.1 argininosuccinate synthase [Acidobacteriota bacterium]MDE3139787.1 argininosuccinate synthase [Acidobacteriota bacterium]MDE3146645.1 argininosuccinate synthase [Acidobacteriota bacterium]
MKRVVLAYSGGLDTSVAVRWMIEEWGVEVVCVLVDVGQDPDTTESFEDIRARALAAGAIECVVVDARHEMADEFCARAIAANARYEGKYPLVSALSRPVIVRHLVDQARKFDAQAVAHGCTGKGNDQVRFEVGTHALAPDLEVLAPARNWGMTRADSVDFARKWDIPIKATKEKIYSIDENLWGRAVECGEMEDPWASPPEEPMTLTRVRTQGSLELTVSFVAGVPVAIDGVEMPLAELIKTMNDRAGATGFGRIDMVENRRVGIKSREVYECPAALALIAAHADLEDLVLERDLHHEKARLESRWAELVYDGMWFSPLKEALDAFIDETQTHVTGDVRLHFAAPGVMRIVGRRSPRALYDYGLATYDAQDTFEHADSEGFVKIYGLGVKTWAARQGAKHATPPHS